MDRIITVIALQKPVRSAIGGESAGTPLFIFTLQKPYKSTKNPLVTRLFHGIMSIDIILRPNGHGNTVIASQSVPCLKDMA